MLFYCPSNQTLTHLEKTKNKQKMKQKKKNKKLPSKNYGKLLLNLEQLATRRHTYYVHVTRSVSLGADGLLILHIIIIRFKHRGTKTGVHVMLSSLRPDTNEPWNNYNCSKPGWQHFRVSSYTQTNTHAYLFTGNQNRCLCPVIPTWPDASEGVQNKLTHYGKTHCAWWE